MREGFTNTTGLPCGSLCFVASSIAGNSLQATSRTETSSGGVAPTQPCAGRGFHEGHTRLASKPEPSAARGVRDSHLTQSNFWCIIFGAWHLIFSWCMAPNFLFLRAVTRYDDIHWHLMAFDVQDRAADYLVNVYVFVSEYCDEGTSSGCQEQWSFPKHPLNTPILVSRTVFPN